MFSGRHFSFSVLRLGSWHIRISEYVFIRLLINYFNIKYTIHTIQNVWLCSFVGQNRLEFIKLLENESVLLRFSGWGLCLVTVNQFLVTNKNKRHINDASDLVAVQNYSSNVINSIFIHTGLYHNMKFLSFVLIKDWNHLTDSVVNNTESLEAFKALI